MSKDHDCGCSNEGNAWFPLNSKAQVMEDNSLLITPPIGWAYIGFEKKTGKLKTIVAGGTTISCTCTGTGNCLPFVANGPKGSTAGCAGNCTSCTQKQGAKSIVFENGGYVNLAGNVSIAEIPDDLPAAFEAMFEHPEIKEGFNSFLQKMYMGLKWPKMIIGENYMAAPEGFSIITVNVYGRATMVPVPTVSLRTVEGGTSGGAATCKCTSGTCSIRTQSVPFVGSATWCEGSCSGTCTLSNAVVVGNGVIEETYISTSYKF